MHTFRAWIPTLFQNTATLTNQVQSTRYFLPDEMECFCSSVQFIHISEKQEGSAIYVFNTKKITVISCLFFNITSTKDYTIFTSPYKDPSSYDPPPGLEFNMDSTCFVNVTASSYATFGNNFADHGLINQMSVSLSHATSDYISSVTIQMKNSNLSYNSCGGQGAAFVLTRLSNPSVIGDNATAAYSQIKNNTGSTLLLMISNTGEKRLENSNVIHNMCTMGSGKFGQFDGSIVIGGVVFRDNSNGFIDWYSYPPVSEGSPEPSRDCYVTDCFLDGIHIENIGNAVVTTSLRTNSDTNELPNLLQKCPAGEELPSTLLGHRIKTPNPVLNLLVVLRF